MNLVKKKNKQNKKHSHDELSEIQTDSTTKMILFAVRRYEGKAFCLRQELIY